ncbi:antifreeze protein [Flammula alnicola]|nr:antifreeze protein [Flammula alnicola]
MSPNTFLNIVALGLMTLTSCLALGPPAVALGAAGNFIILAKSGVSTVPPSTIIGNLGLSPAASPFFTGFSIIRSASGTSASSTQVVGSLQAADFTSPTPSTLTTSESAMITAFNDAAGRLNPTAIGLGADAFVDKGTIGGLTFTPGIYKWTSNVNMPTSITISGSSTDTWIFQVAGTLTVASGKAITLSGGALAKNIVWVVSGAVTIGSGAVFKGVVLGATSVALNTGAILQGRILAQTAVTLQEAVVTS